MHTHRTWKHGRRMGDAILGRTTKEKDIGIACSADTKHSEQYGIVASKANQILELIRELSYIGRNS